MFSGNYKENFYNKEERFKKLLKTMEFKLNIVSNNNNLNNKKICDIGCATGEFLYFLNKKYPNNKLTGYDINKDYIDKGKENCKAINFLQGNILDTNLIKENEYDIIMCSGIIQIFENFELCYKNLIKWSKKGGKIYVFGMFNEYPYDCFIKFRHTNESELQEGWHNISKETIIKTIEKYKVSNYKFYKFNMPIETEKKKNLLRAWTIKSNHSRQS